MKHFDVIIVGGGAVGSSIAWRLSRYNLSVALVDKEVDVAIGTSGRNSAVVHAGFNNRPGSLMAKLCVQGNEEFEELAKLLDVPYKKTGKMLVGYNEEDKQALLKLIAQGEANGCKGLRLIEEDEIRALDPNVPAKWAMLSPNTAIISPFLYNIHMAEAAVKNGVTFLPCHEVTAIRKDEKIFVLDAGNEQLSCDILINSAGLFADKVSAMAGDDRYKIYPCRGEYYLMDKMPEGLLPMPIYPVPRPGVGGLGVHLTPTIDGNMIIGPSAEYVEGHEDLGTTQKTLNQLEREAKELYSVLNMRTVIGTYAGMRAKLVAKGQANYGDFVIEHSPKVQNLIQLIGIESPGLTASMPIAKMVEGLVLELISPAEKENWDGSYKGIPCFAELSQEEQARLIAENPEYGDVVCRCETVTKAEIRAAFENPLGARSLVSIKNRVRATMGRCNGGYCFTRMVNMLKDEYGIPVEDISYKRENDHPFVGSVK